MIKVIKIIFFTFFTFACNRNDSSCNQKNYANYQLINTKKLSFTVSTNDSYMGFSNHVLGNLLFRASYFEDVIYIYDLLSEKKIDEIRFSEEGINHISGFQGAAIIPISLDTFFIANNFSKVYLTHRDSVIYSNLTIDDDILSPREYRSYGVNRVKPIIVGNKVYMLKVSQYLVGSGNFMEDKTLMNFDLKSKRIKELSVLFPKKYDHEIWAPRQYMVSFTSWRNKLVINYPIIDELYIYDNKSDGMVDTVKCVRSRYIKSEIKSSNHQFTDVKTHNRYLKQNSFYWSIDFVPEKNLFFRIIIPPPENDDDKLSIEKPEAVSPFSVMILDKDFNVLAEEKYPGKIYDITDYFVTPEGLWISNNNPENPNFSEDHLSFTLFELADKKE